jgi:hypothetical protein
LLSLPFITKEVKDNSKNINKILKIEV